MSVEFIPNIGYRLIKNRRSIILHATALTKLLTNAELIGMSLACREYLDAVNERSASKEIRPSVTPAENPQLKGDVAYKFTDDIGVEFWRSGSVQLSPLATYLTIENEGRQDPREGLGVVDLAGEEYSATFWAAAGFNTRILCTSIDARRSERNYRAEKFGRRIVKIQGVTEFAAKVASLAGASRHVVRDVTYSDAKLVRGISSLPEKFVAANGTGDLKLETLEMLANEHLDELIATIEAASVFTKPTSYYLERERRLMFEFSSDVTSTIAVKDASLLKHLEVVV